MLSNRQLLIPSGDPVIVRRGAFIRLEGVVEGLQAKDPPVLMGELPRYPWKPNAVTEQTVGIPVKIATLTRFQGLMQIPPSLAPGEYVVTFLCRDMQNDCYGCGRVRVVGQ